MPLVNLPPGNSGLRMFDGTRYRAARPGGQVNVSEEHARHIDRMSGNGDAGLVGRASFHEYGAVSKPGRWCLACRRLWYPWSLTCSRCGAATEPERA